MLPRYCYLVLTGVASNGASKPWRRKTLKEAYDVQRNAVERHLKGSA